MVPRLQRRAIDLKPACREIELGVAATLPSTASRPGAPTDEAALNRLVALVHDDLEACNRTIVARMQSPVALIPQLAAHLVAAGGKRLRPLLTLASARLSGYAGGERHINLAACVEFIHTATLLHDDVVDESLLRRGLASANAVFGNKPSVLVGDFLFARAFQLMVADGSLKVLEILSRAAATIAEGEVLQLAPASVIAPFQYAGIIWAILLGYTAFGDVPDQTLIIGALIIIGAGLFILWRERAGRA